MSAKKVEFEFYTDKEPFELISKIFTNKEEFVIATVAPYLDNEKIDFLIALL